MDPVLKTERLKLTLITRAERGSEELSWLHELRSNKQTMAWSIHPPSTTIEDTEKILGAYLPSIPSASPPSNAVPPPPSAEQAKAQESKNKAYKLAYAVHEVPQNGAPRFIGLVNLASLPASHLRLPAHLVIPKEEEKTTLVVELAYSFLPTVWARGYATEAITAVLQACRGDANARFWRPWSNVYMRVIVNGRNPASQRVMAKCGIERKGIFKWEGEKIFIGGEWRTEDDLHIYGCYLRGGDEEAGGA